MKSDMVKSDMGTLTFCVGNVLYSIEDKYAE